MQNTKLQTQGSPLPDALVVSSEWRNYMLARKRSAQGNAFNTTLQGQGPEASARGPRENYKPKCVCGEKHWYPECPYIFPEKRPDGWRPDPEVEKHIQNTIATDEKVRRGIEKAKEKHSPSASSSSGSPASSSDSPAHPTPEPPTETPGLAGASYKVPTQGLVG